MEKRKASSALPLVIIGVGLILVSVVGVYFWAGLRDGADVSTSEKPSVVPASVNFPAPELILADLSGESVSIAGLKGQVVLINNWATWCPPCRAEMPELEVYYQAHQDEDFTLIGISAGDTVEQIENFVTQYQLSFPMWVDLDTAALLAFRNNGLPSSYVIDKTGRVRLAWTGAISLEMLEKYVTPLLRE